MVEAPPISKSVNYWLQRNIGPVRTALCENLISEHGLSILLVRRHLYPNASTTNFKDIINTNFYLIRECRSGSDRDIHLVFPSPLTINGERWRLFLLTFDFWSLCLPLVVTWLFFFASWAHFRCKYFWHGEEIFLLTTESLPWPRSTFAGEPTSYFEPTPDFFGSERCFDQTSQKVSWPHKMLVLIFFFLYQACDQ